MPINLTVRTCGIALCALLAACAPRLYQRETVAVDHRDIDQFEIRYADFEGCLWKQQVPISYRLKRPAYVLDLGVHFGNKPEAPSLDISLSGAADLTARFPALAQAPQPTETEDSVRYRVSADQAGSTLAMTVLRDGVAVGEEHLRLERSTCRALSVGE
ncbi:hypothetical protein DFR24_3586 [Panacagrimonas perspica]|uniref:Uncharacterized protein n=1 Tax=Panacagrimonas perspica TaxID=381431 RepID=A0A4S3K6W0_9GAMM|nr:hypothetical protein [Panacagrimonas perspica]TDU26557.1 hypothetical protein DFR24_3586 [Panacagrimonas perspica]THD03925.1 hypothetical protein B1810_06555 [Panacagrimonas perspica]